MTELADIQNSRISEDELIPKVTKAVGGKLTGKFIVGLFYERNEKMCCFSVPGNSRKVNWSETPDKAISAWKTINPNDKRVVVNPFLL